MEKISIDIKLYTEIWKCLFKAGVIFFEDKGITNSKTALNEDNIGRELQARDKSFSETILRNMQDNIRDFEKGRKKSTTIGIDRATSIENFFNDVAKSNLLKGISGEELRNQLIDLVNQIHEAKQTKIQSKHYKSSKSETIPDYLFGVYRGYFIRPLIEDPNNHIAMLVISINRPKGVDVRSTKDIKYMTGTTFYQKEQKLLVCKFEGTNKSATHIFQFSLKLEDKEVFKNRPILKGIYGGTDPEKTSPTCGKIILEKVEDSKIDVKTLYEQTLPIDFVTERSIADLFIKKQDIFNFLRSNDYIEDISFFKNYSIEKRKDLGVKKIEGIYTIFTLHSSEFSIGIGTMKIGRLGDVVINGSDGLTYYGFAKIFDQDILSINVLQKKVSGNMVTVDYYFNYLFKLIFDETRQEFFHGMRTIIAETEGKRKPSAARVIIKVNKEIHNKILDSIKADGNDTETTGSLEILYKKYESKLFYEIISENIVILPYKWNRDVKRKKLILDLNSKPTRQIDGSFEQQIVDYLIGDSNNLMTAKGVGSEEFSKREKLPEVYFYAAINYANRNLEEDARFYFDRAFIHGFSGEKYWKMLKNEPNLTAHGKRIVKLIKSIDINGHKYFYFEDSE